MIDRPKHIRKKVGRRSHRQTQAEAMQRLNEQLRGAKDEVEEALLWLQVELQERRDKEQRSVLSAQERLAKAEEALAATRVSIAEYRRCRDAGIPLDVSGEHPALSAIISMVDLAQREQERLDREVKDAESEVNKWRKKIVAYSVTLEDWRAMKARLSSA